MPIALDQNLGSNSAHASAPGTMTITTTQPAAAGTLIVVVVSWFSTGTVSTVSDGTAYALDKAVVNGNDKLSIFSRYTATGLASGSTITITQTGSGAGGELAGAASFTGVLSSGSLVTTGSNTTTGTTWSSGAATNTGQADAVYVGGAGNETATSTTSTPSSGTEIHDAWFATDQQGIATGYKAVSTVASDSLTGTWVGVTSTATTGGLAIYAAAPSAVVQALHPRRMPLGV